MVIAEPENGLDKVFLLLADINCCARQSSQISTRRNIGPVLTVIKVKDDQRTN
ncbi:hypothetical protein ACVNPZ_02260 [Staphylococcus aureus]